MYVLPKTHRYLPWTVPLGPLSTEGDVGRTVLVRRGPDRGRDLLVSTRDPGPVKTVRVHRR